MCVCYGTYCRGGPKSKVSYYNCRFIINFVPCTFLSQSAALDQVLVKTDGYTLSRSASKVKMNIQTAAFFGETGNKVESNLSEVTCVYMGACVLLAMIVQQLTDFKTVIILQITKCMLWLP